MKNLIEFIKTTVIGGLVLIVPVAVLFIALGYVLSLLVRVNNAVAEYVPVEVFGHPAVIIALAVCSIVAFCFIAGLLLKTGVGDRLAKKLDALLEDKLPLYGMVRTLTQRFTGIDGLEFAPAEVDLYSNETRVLAFVIEELPTKRYVVFVPSSPALTMGQVYILPASSVRLLDKPTKLAVDAITQWGVGTKLLYGEALSAQPSDPS